MSVALTKKELAELTGYTYRRLYDIDRALPKGEKLFVQAEGDADKCDLKTFFQRWLDYQLAQNANEAFDDLETAKAKHEAVKMRKTEIEVARMEGELIPLQDVERLWTSVAATVNTRFVNMPRKLAPALVMIGSADAVEAIIEAEVKDALSMMSKTPVPKPTEETGEEDEG